MSTMGITYSEKFSKKSTHRRNPSGELDVFEASRYFSGAVESTGSNTRAVSQKSMKEERPMWEGGRKSVDLSMKNPLVSELHRPEKHIKEKKSKQPSSPGGRFASFLNNLFSQTASKKKKSKSSTQSMKDDDESPSGRRKRRSSISHFQGISSTEAKSMYSSSRSGFRTPPPYSHNSIKVCKDLSSDQKPVTSLSKCNGQPRSVTFYPQNEVLDEKKQMDLAWLDEKLKFSDGFLEKNKMLSNGFLEKHKAFLDKNGIRQKDRIWVDELSSEEKGFRRAEEVDDGGESDSSSDLFELPVYETTHMESIKRGVPIVHGIH
ncbi:protein BIG GRAIN 1-like E [Tasmannia lanceolata]|uniref:protein BIG GRAIN 1-like E n=1 Tax=Tasmannia lanceolata TaxID=3420 RepID=UPI004063DDAE